MKRIIFILTFLITTTCLQAQINNLQRPFDGFNRAVKIDNIAFIDSADVGGFFITKDSTGNTVDNLNIFPTKDPAIRWVRVVNSSVSIITGESTTYLFEDSTNNPPTVFPPDVDTTFWMVGGAPTGIFVDHDFDVAVYVDGVFDVFIDPNVNDWGLTLDDNFWHQYNGSTWPRRNPPDWTTSGNFNGGIMGSLVPQIVYLRYNNINRIILLPAGVRIPSVSSTTLSLVGANATGLLRDIAIDTLSLIIEDDTLRATGGGGTPSVVFDSLTWISAQNWGILPTNSEATNTANASDAIDYLVSRGGGTLYFPYADSAYKVQIIIPGQDPSSLKIAIRILGANPPSYMFGTVGTFTLPVKGAILKSESTSGSVIEAEAFSGDFSFITLYVENIELRTYPNPLINGINALWASQLIVNNVFINTNIYNVQAIQPTNITYGIVTPNLNNGAFTILTNVSVTGHYGGININEHTSGTDITIASCYNGILIGGGGHATHFNRLGMYRNHFNVVHSGNTNAFLKIEQMNIEQADSATQTTDSTTWQITYYDLVDAGNYLRGSISWNGVIGNVGQMSAFLRNGGDSVSLGTNGVISNYKVPLNVTQSYRPTISATNPTATQSASIMAINSSAQRMELAKAGGSVGAFKNIGANDGYLYNEAGGNMSFLNDNGSGNINWAAGGASASQMILTNGGQLQVTGAGSPLFNITNTSASAFAAMNFTNSSTQIGQLFKAGASYSGYRNLQASDFGIYTSNGNQSYLNDNATGNFNFAIASATPVVTINSNGLTSTQYRLSALNAAPSSASDTGTTGEVRITSTFIYVCVATNTWVRAALATW